MKSSGFVIENGVPIPGPTHKRHGGSMGCMYPFADMDIGDSFEAPRDMGMNGKHDCRQNSIASAAHGWALRNSPGAAFRTQMQDLTVRCWRIK